MRKQRIARMVGLGIIMLIGLGTISCTTSNKAIVAVNNPEPLFPAKVKDKYGFINSKGQMMIQPRFNSVGEFSDGLAPVMLHDPQRVKLDPDGTRSLRTEMLEGLKASP